MKMPKQLLSEEKYNEHAELLSSDVFSIEMLKKSLKRIQYGLYITLLLNALLPTIYSTVRISLLGSLPTSSGINVASQAVWLSLIFKVFQEFLMLPLYCKLGKTINDDTKTANKIKTGFLCILFIFTFLSILLYFLLPDLNRLMAQNKDLQNKTTDYVRFSSKSN